MRVKEYYKDRNMCVESAHAFSYCLLLICKYSGIIPFRNLLHGKCCYMYFM